MNIYKKRMNAFFNLLLTEGAEVIDLFPDQEQPGKGGKDYVDYAADTPEQTNRQFINELYNAVVEKTGTTGFGFLFEKILVDNAQLVGLANPRPLNLPGAEGETNTAFADIIADGDIYYSVKCSIWDGGTPEERNITEVNASKSSSIIKLAESLAPDTDWDAGGYFDMKCGVITGHPSSDTTAKEKFQKLGYVVQILGPAQENIRIRKDQAAGELIAVMLDASGSEVMQSRKPSKKERDTGIEDNISYYGIKEKPTSASAFQTKLFHPSIEQTSSSKTITLKISPFRSAQTDPSLEEKIIKKLYKITVASGISAAQRATTASKEVSASDAKREIERVGALGPSSIYRSQQGSSTKSARIMRGVARAKRVFSEVKKLMFVQGHKFEEGQAELMGDAAMAFCSSSEEVSYSKDQQVGALVQLLGSLDDDVIAQALAIAMPNAPSLNLVKEADEILSMNDPDSLVLAIANRVYKVLDEVTPENGPRLAEYIIKLLRDTGQYLAMLSEPEEADLAMVAEAAVTRKRLLQLAGLDKK